MLNVFIQYGIAEIICTFICQAKSSTPTASTLIKNGAGLQSAIKLNQGRCWTMDGLVLCQYQDIFC